MDTQKPKFRSQMEDYFGPKAVRLFVVALKASAAIAALGLLVSISNWLFERGASPGVLVLIYAWIATLFIANRIGHSSGFNAGFREANAEWKEHNDFMRRLR